MKDNSINKIAIYGGTFDPWHNAHAEITEYLSKNFDLVFLVPTNVKYYKSNETMFSFSERCEKLIQVIIQFPNVKICDIESNISGSWRFIDTLKSIAIKYFTDAPDKSTISEIAENLKKNKTELYVAIGSDSLQKFKTWTAWEDILKLAKLEVFRRPGYEDNFPDIPYNYVWMNNPESSTRIRNEILKNK